MQPIHIPAYMVEMMSKLKTANARAGRQLGRQPMVEELSAHMKMSPKKVRIIRKAAKAFNAPTQSGSADGEMTIEDMVPDDNNPGPDQIVLDTDDQRKARRAAGRTSASARRTSSSSATASAAKTR